ncbi:tripartite tricarboxylate transporter TctB family protein [Corynebacterium halotolerans]|uniref:tripartite tricarboxylate transporter TctB family protein n=1 Tax=Corynebacterium halotolerans TaxID=225326 RepID=UPI003CEE530F
MTITGQSEIPEPEEVAVHTGKRAPVISEWLTCAAIALMTVIVIAQMFGIGVGTLSEPGPGLWPLMISVVILAAVPFAVLDKSASESYRVASMARPALMAAALLAFLPLYPLLGFILATFVTMFVITRWVCHEGLITSALVSLVTPTVAYLLFGFVFKVALSPLPLWLGL